MNRGYVNRCLRWLANEMFPFYFDGELPKELEAKVDTFYKSIEGCIDWYNMTRKDLLRLGFLNLEEDEDVTNSLWLIPTWLFPVIPEGMTVYDADKKPFAFFKNSAPQDVMYGCYTFGIFEQTTEEVTDDIRANNTGD